MTDKVTPGEMTAASPPAANSPVTPLKAHETLSKICEEMRLWIRESPVPPKAECLDEMKSQASDATTGAYQEEDNPASSYQDGGASEEPQHQTITENEVQDGNIKNEAPLDAPRTTNTQSRSTAKPTGIERSPESGLESTVSVASILHGPQRSSQHDIPAPISDARTSTDELVVSCPPAPLHVIHAAFPSPPGLEARACMSALSWSISSICLSEHTETGVIHDNALNEAELLQNKSTVPEEFTGDYEGKLVGVAKEPTSYDRDDPVNMWLAKYLTSPSVSISHGELEEQANIHCDISPEKGSFLPAVVQPDTIRFTEPGPCVDCNDINWRQINMTTELQIKREMQARENVARKSRVAPYDQPTRDEPLSQSDQDSWLNAQCNIRPANELDFPLIAGIINEEKKNMSTGKLQEDAIVTTEDVARVWNECRADKRPFIVLTPASENLLDRSKWPKHSDEIFEEFSRFVAEHPKPAPLVAGFAFVTGARLGLDGRPCPRSRYSGRLTLIVHPDHRRKLYGSALLDCMLMILSPFHTKMVEYEWTYTQDIALRGIYEWPACHNTQQYTHLHAEIVVSQETNEANAWKMKFPERFDFKEVGRFKNGLVFVDQQCDMHWQDLVLMERIITPTSKIFARH